MSYIIEAINSLDSKVIEISKVEQRGRRVRE